MANTEPDNYGPLQLLIGTWKGDSGMDIAPEPDGKEENPYYETLIFTPVGCVSNADEQVLMAIHYQQIIQRKSNDQVFHHQCGYWSWDMQASTVMHNFVIPRGVAVVSGGQFNADYSQTPVEIEVSASRESSEWTISESPFMQKKASTLAFNHKMFISESQLVYTHTTMVDIYGNIFEHTDTNQLTRQAV